MTARQWLTEYVRRNRRTMTGTQIRAVSTTARQIPDDMTVMELAETLLSTMPLNDWEAKPIYNIGKQTAKYILGILAEPGGESRHTRP